MRRTTLLSAAAAALALALGAVVPAAAVDAGASRTLARPAAAAPTSPEAQADDASGTLEPERSPGQAGVDGSVLVGVPRGGTAPEQVAALMDGQAELLGAAVVLLDNPGPADRASLVRVRAPRAVAGQVAEAMVTSGLFDAVDYEAAATAAYSGTPNDTLYANPSLAAYFWGLRAAPGARFDEVWPQLGGFGTPGTPSIAVIDSGCVLSHEDNVGNIVAGYDFGSGDGDVTPDNVADPEEWHGTAVASVIAAGTDNARGIAGATWDSRVLCYKVADAAGRLSTSATANSVLDAIKQGVRVINISMGSATPSSFEQWAISEAVASGVVVVASAGNNGIAPDEPGGPVNPPNYPAGYADVVSVGSIDPAGAPSTFSNSNPATSVDIAAPGEDIAAWAMPTAASATPGYTSWDGTSFSAPLVASAAAIILRAKPGLSSAAVAGLLTGTAVDVGAPGWDAISGAGRLDAAAAVAAALAAPTPGWLTAPHDGVFTIATGQPFSLPLGVGGDPLPTVELTGGALPPGASLGVDAYGRPSILGTVMVPGTYQAVITAVQAGAVIGSVTLVIGVSGDGAYQATAKLAKAKVTAAGQAKLRLTVTAQSGTPSGWYDVARTGGATLATGTFFPGTQTLALGYLKPGTYHLTVTLHRAMPYGQPQQDVRLGGSIVLTVVKAAPSVTLKAARRTLTVRVKAAAAVGTVSGKAVVKYGKVRKVVAVKKGKAVLKKLPAGRYKVKVTYKGATKLKAKTVTKKLTFR
jgi:hypothetical protein